MFLEKKGKIGEKYNFLHLTVIFTYNFYNRDPMFSKLSVILMIRLKNNKIKLKSKNMLPGGHNNGKNGQKCEFLCFLSCIHS